MLVVAASTRKLNIQRILESLGHKNSLGMVILLDEMACEPQSFDAALSLAANGFPALLIGSCAQAHYCREPIVRQAFEGQRCHFRQIGDPIPEAILRADLAHLAASIR